MRLLLQAISLLALLATITPPVLFMAGAVELPAVKTAMWISTAVWFVAAPLARPASGPVQSVTADKGGDGS